MDEDAGLNIECQRKPFKANPIPKACSVLIYDKKIQEEDQKRRKSVHEKAELLLAQSKMPSRMQKDMDRKKQLPPKDLAEQYTFKPKLGNTDINAEKFATMQRKFSEKLLARKSQTAITRPRSPNFQPSKHRPLSREYVNEKPAMKKAPKTAREREEMYQEVKQPSSTLKTEWQIQYTRQKIEKQQAEEYARKIEEAEREKRQKRVSLTDLLTLSLDLIFCQDDC